MDRRILVVDDSQVQCTNLISLLGRRDRHIKAVHDTDSALECLGDGSFSLVITDLMLDGDGLDRDPGSESDRNGGLALIRAIASRNLPVTSLVLTGHASIDSAVEAMKLGAHDYITKPYDPGHLEHVVDRALADRRLQDEVAALRRGWNPRFCYHELLGRGARMRELFVRLARFGPRSCPVLITGETGTGKDLVARALHAGSGPDRRGPMVTVNCGALPESLLESELFGHEAGAFTGADRRRVGRFEQADGGTLFLDEIGEMPPGMQAKLLRVLQDGSFERVGGTETLRVNIRLLAATNIDLAAAVASGKFREDLYYRLNGVTVEVPALRDRDPENVPLLIDHCLNRIRQRGGPTWTFSAEALRRLSSYAWPGNVRELENLVELMVVIAPGREIQLEDLPAHIVPSREEPVSLAFDLQRPLPKITEELTARVESAYLRRVLETYRGRIDACAAHCKLSRRSISEKLRRHNIDKSEYKIDRTRRAPAAGAL